MLLGQEDGVSRLDLGRGSTHPGHGSTDRDATLDVILAD